MTQAGGRVREGFLEAVALGLTKPPGALKGHVCLGLPTGRRLMGSPM